MFQDQYVVGDYILTIFYTSGGDDDNELFIFVQKDMNSKT